MSQLGAPEAASLKRVLSGNLCAGCGLCAAVSEGEVQMSVSEDGYNRPVQKGKLSDTIDRLISEVCPGLRLEQTSEEGDSHTIWGPYISVRAGASTDAELRYHGSSGAVLSALLTHLLGSGVVERVVQTAASNRAPVENMTVTSGNAQDIYNAAGSRYAPSSPLADLHKELEKPGKFALVGKPCDIAAARALALRDPRVDEKIPFMLSFFCGGVPSLKGAQAILAALEVVESDVKKFRFRGEGWPGWATAVLEDGSERRMSYAESWGGILSRHVQFRCKICPDGVGEFADIVCADAWYGDEDGYPKFDEEEGRSLIIARTSRGEELVNAALSDGIVDAQDLDVDQIGLMQPSQAKRKQLILSRLFGMFVLGRTRPTYRGLNLKRAALKSGLFPNVKSALGMMRRLLRARD